MRELDSAVITEAVARMCVRAATVLPEDALTSIRGARETETGETARGIMDIMLQNAGAAARTGVPICQDTGLACVFLEIGQDVHITGSLRGAVDEGVRRGYTEGYLRKSAVRDPFDRVNTGDNTPAMQYYDIVPGESVRITVAPKGFGSENMSRIKMLRPADGARGAEDFIVETVRLAGPNPCPPVVVGVGVGGTFDKAALLAKKALLRPLGRHSGDAYYRDMETRLLARINALGIGPQGFGGDTTALWVSVEHMPTHIAGLPCAVNLNCHVSRHVTEVI